MKILQKIRSFRGLEIILILGLIFAVGLNGAYTQVNEPLRGQGLTVVKNVVIGPHPIYSRILINLNQPHSYKIKADFLKKKVTFQLKNTVLGQKAHSRNFRDGNLSRVEFLEKQGNIVEVTVYLKKRNSRFFHLLKTEPAQIVVDVLGHKKPFLKTNIKVPRKVVTKVKGMTSAEIEEALQKNRELKVRSGLENYQMALKTYQDKLYKEALELFRKYRKQYPKSKYLGDIAYLTAQAEFNIVSKKPIPNFEKSLDAFKFAVRKYPKSKFYDHARTKLAFIYDQMGMVLEAKIHYNDLLKERPKGLFTNFIKAQLASLLIDQNKFEEALIEFKNILKLFPNDLTAREGILKVAKWHYEQGNFQKALSIFEYMKKEAKKENRKPPQERFWQILFNKNADADFFIGEIYFRNENFSKARRHYFDFINLKPETPLAFQALNRIGDTYFLQGNDMASLAIFDESAKNTNAGREAQYGKIRLADIGVRNPNLKLNDIILDVEPYFHPLKTYDSIIQNAQDTSILAEALLSQGIAFLRSQRYLDAIDQLKLLLAMKPEKKYSEAAEKYIRQGLILLIEKLSKQNGNLPILYTYGDYLGMGLGDINNVKTILLIGESYQKIGMVQEAIRHYERVKRMDTRKTYSDRIFFNLGKIHLEQNNPVNAERVARTFLNKYPRSELVPETRNLIAESLEVQNRPEEAIAVYNEILDRGPKNESIIHFKIAQIRENQKQYAEAVAAYQRSIDTYDRGQQPQPQHVPLAYYQLGFILYQDKKFEQAIESLDRSRNLYPNNSQKSYADFLITEAYALTKKNKQAVNEMNTIVKTEKSDDIFKKVAEAKLKILDWEKQFKDVL